MKNFILVVVAILGVVILTGCSCNTGCKKSNSCSGKPMLCTENGASMSECLEFISMKDPCADGRACSIEEKKRYAELGQKCAMRMGMVPINPKTCKPEIENPIVVTVDSSQGCPPSVCDAGGYAYSAKAQMDKSGFLLTVYDTEKGPKYVLLKADEKFDASVKFNEVAKSSVEIAKIINGMNGKVAVYLTAFPLIVPENSEKSRQPNEAEIKELKLLTKNNSEEITFVNWQ